MKSNDIFRASSHASPSRNSVTSQCSISASTLQSLADRFPFTEKELEQLVGCYETKFKNQNVVPLRATLGPAKSLEEDMLNHLEEEVYEHSIRSSILTSKSFDTSQLLAELNGHAMIGVSHGHLGDDAKETILDKLASSAEVLFSKEDTIRRVRLVQEKVLPWRFTESLDKTLKETVFVSTYSLEETVDEEMLHFLENLAVCMGRRGPRQVIDIIFDSCTTTSTSSQEGLHESPAIDLIRLCYSLAVSSHILSEASTSTSVLALTEALDEEMQTPHQLLASLIEYAKSTSAGQKSDKPAFQFEKEDSFEPDSSHVNPMTKITKAQFRQWIDITVPLLASTMPTFLHDLLFLGKPFPTRGVTAFRLPDIRQHTSNFFHRSPRLRISNLSFCFSTMAPEFCKRFHQLYSLEANGCSFPMLSKALIGYNGPVVIIASAEGGGIFGAYCSVQWKTSGEYFGDYDCFLFRISPCLNIYRPTGNKTHFVYLNPSTRLKCDGKAHGLGFGGTHYAPRFFIPENFEDEFCRAGAFDLTYEQGPLLPGNWQLADRFKLQNLEIWGVGDPSIVEAALMAQEQKRRIDDASLRRAQLVDKRAFVDDLYAYSDNALFAHRQQARGRAEFKVNDGHSGYAIDREAEDVQKSVRNLQNSGLLDDLPPSSPTRSTPYTFD